MGVQVVAFDVNETLLDLSACDSRFETIFGDSSLRAQWFAQMLHSASSLGHGDLCRPHHRQHAALSILADRQGVQLTSGDAESIVGAMSSLPVDSDVAPALQRLHAQPARVVALTTRR